MNTIQYHFVASGPNSGKVAACDAKVKCRNGGLHVPQEQLGGVIAYLQHVRGEIIQPKNLNHQLVSDVLETTSPKVIEAYSKVADVFTLPTSDIGPSLFSSGALGKAGHHLYNLNEEVRDIELGNSSLSRQEAGGYLIDQKYFADYEIEGSIDVVSLDETSFSKFGFYRPESNNRPNLDEDILHKLSTVEMANLTREQRAAVRIYTSSAYEWINASLNNESRTYRAPDYLDKAENQEALLSGETLNPNYTIVRGTVDKTDANLKEVTKALDEALDSGPKKQRIVYRGMSRTLNMFSIDPKTNAKIDFSETNVQNYVDHHMQLGTVMHFDSYQSTSQLPETALSYARDYGLVYEIRTSRGLNLTSASMYTGEGETLLPRDAKYMVVGIHKNASMKNGLQRRKGLTVVQLVEVTGDNEVVSEHNTPTSAPLTERQLLAD